MGRVTKIIKYTRAGKMNDKELNEKIAEVLELAESEKLEYVKSDLVIFARQQILMGNTSPDYIISHFFDNSIY